MKIKTLHRITGKKYGPKPAGVIMDVPEKIARVWIEQKAAEEVKEEPVEKPKAPVKEKAVQMKKTEKAVK